MKAFLCSSPYNNHDKVFRKNSLRTQLKNAWPEKARICYIASDPDDYVTTDNYVRVHSRAYREHFKIDSWQTIDHRLYEPEKYLKKANIKDWKNKKHGPHALRHSLATNLLKNNIAMPIISTVMGHQRTETTSIYLSLDYDKLKQCALTMPVLRSPFYCKDK